MTERSRGTHGHVAGLTRRELVQAGYSGLLGLGLPSLWTSQVATAKPKRAKSVVVSFLTSAPSHSLWSITLERRGQNEFGSWSFRGRPLDREVDSSPSRWAVSGAHDSSPNGRPRSAESRSRCRSPLESRSFNGASESSSRSAGSPFDSIEP
jgi:hypothetical protein